jgi:hypothetical protein
MQPIDSFTTPRLHAERLTAAHWLDLRRMDQDEPFMAMLGGVRDEAGTVAYLEMNVKHWADHGFGMWMLRDAISSAGAGDRDRQGLCPYRLRSVRVPFPRRDHHAVEPGLTACHAESGSRLRARHRACRHSSQVVPLRPARMTGVTHGR